MKPIWVYDPIFTRNIYIFYKWKEADFNKYMIKNYDIRFEVSDYEGLCSEIIYERKKLLIIWVDKIENIKAISTLAHEAVHASSFVFKNAHQKLDSDNDELQAYYVGMIVKAALTGGF